MDKITTEKLAGAKKALIENQIKIRDLQQENFAIQEFILKTLITNGWHHCLSVSWGRLNETLKQTS